MSGANYTQPKRPALPDTQKAVQNDQFEEKRLNAQLLLQKKLVFDYFLTSPNKLPKVGKQTTRP